MASGAKRRNNGTVWYPQSVPTNWAPYRDGHWAYVAPWGWTWIDDAPWGFNPVPLRAAGFRSVIAGPGCRANGPRVRSMHRPW